ncbi:MAG: ImmA/IrrE family metallo-endopeptidase [Clostridia bacterium]|nr:ImmA/IrrE family metallo-endopeptidase [Clostridia bacterium]
MFNSIKILKYTITPEELAQAFLREYFGEEKAVYPLNPFEMLKKVGVPFSFRNFEKYEGVYLQVDNDGPAVVGINANRPITRQRFTAAHELCHHIKDAGQDISCLIAGKKNKIERYAEDFAAAILMPINELIHQVKRFDENGYVSFESVLRIANYFGVSFESCLYRIAYRLHKIEGDTSAVKLKKRIAAFKPKIKCQQLGLNDLKLYEQLFDTNAVSLFFEPTEFAKRKFQTEYIFNDSRLEGVDVDKEMVSEIVTDLKLKKQESEYCNFTNKNVIEVAGLTAVYNEVFQMSRNREISVFDTLDLHRTLYCYAPYPEGTGHFRNTNNIVSEAKFETVDKDDIFYEFVLIDEKVKKLLEDSEKISTSEYIERVLDIHYKLTTIHPFADGNGRISRAFLNLLFLKNNIPPIFFTDNNKNEYKNALKEIDTKNNKDTFYEIAFRRIIEANSKLMKFII